MIIKSRNFKDKDYLKFIRSLPCCVRHTRDYIDAHHVKLKGMGGGNVNDYYAVPLERELHTGGMSHISFTRLEELLGEDPKDIVIFYLALYIEFLNNNYDRDADEQACFIELKRKKAGLI